MWCSECWQQLFLDILVIKLKAGRTNGRTGVSALGHILTELQVKLVPDHRAEEPALPGYVWNVSIHSVKLPASRYFTLFTIKVNLFERIGFHSNMWNQGCHFLGTEGGLIRSTFPQGSLLPFCHRWSNRFGRFLKCCIACEQRQQKDECVDALMSSSYHLQFSEKEKKCTYIHLSSAYFLWFPSKNTEGWSLWKFSTPDL